MKIMFDMDGVLCNFNYWIEYNHAVMDDGKTDWAKLIQIGTPFWSNMPWIIEGNVLYNMVLKYIIDHPDIEIGIHSGIYWKTGKYCWLNRNCPEIDSKNIIIDDRGHSKHITGNVDEILVDDCEENVKAYIESGFPAVLFTTAEETFKNVVRLIEKKI